MWRTLGPAWRMSSRPARRRRGGSSPGSPVRRVFPRCAGAVPLVRRFCRQRASRRGAWLRRFRSLFLREPLFNPPLNPPRRPSIPPSLRPSVRSESHWCPFAALCNALRSLCCDLQRLGAVFLPYATIRSPFPAFCNDSVSFSAHSGPFCIRCRIMQNAAPRPHIVAERNERAPHRCTTQQNESKFMQNAAQRPETHAERSFSKE